MGLVKSGQLVSIVVGCSKIERIVDQAFPGCISKLVVQCFEGCSLRIAVGISMKEVTPPAAAAAGFCSHVGL